MKEQKIFDAVTNVPDELVEEAKNTKIKRAFPSWKRWSALAACIALIIGIVYISPYDGSSSETALLDVVFPKAYAFDDVDAKQAVIESNPVDDALLTALNGFSYKTASQIFADRSGNANYSPLSLYYALAMAASGAGGETADEMLSVLGISDQTTLSVQCGNLYRQLYMDNQIGKLKIANSLWMDSDIDWEKDFIKNAAGNFYASSFSVDFSDRKTGKSMSKWISDHTNGTLKPELEIDADQVLSILNTVYFYDEWTNQFDQAKTAEAPFYLPDGTAVNCDFMNRFASSGFAVGDGFTRSSLGLKNAGSMIFILPDEGVSPGELLSTPEKMQAAFEGGEERQGEVVWQVPKFGFETKLEPADALKSLGITSAFEQDADFSGITSRAAFISDINQETHIALDENGVEASAFTEIAFALGAAPPEDKAEMILNRPFIYGITAPNGTLLFVGVCENPAVK